MVFRSRCSDSDAKTICVCFERTWLQVDEETLSFTRHAVILRLSCCNFVEQSTKWRSVCYITKYFQRKTGQVLGTRLLFSAGSELVCTKTASDQPTGHSGLTSKAEGVKVSTINRDAVSVKSIVLVSANQSVDTEHQLQQLLSMIPPLHHCRL